MNILDAPIKRFMESLDQVLNNAVTVLLDFPLSKNTLEEDVENLLRSDDFIERIYKVDSDMDYGNYHYYDFDEDNNVVQRRWPLKILRDNYQLMISKPAVDKMDYLMAMLTGDTTRGKFFSFYRREKSRAEAEEIIIGFISAISRGAGWELYVIDPGFLEYNDDEKDEMGYLIEDYGNNNVLVITCNETGYLIMTNGVD